ncbi:N-acetylmuramoyl-L-alanine amidase family protein [Croceibacterium aestuarii]|uniref:N-acetylmuramoyl-L-alanine amidase family protein n=1 Tax=Croceibacterium aestuarii TaxID=3064139 RepID=UPI00272EA2E6|nr:N-acetylmuramoyl-L-alanine amidase [Croceibacterium sp. D39]
MWHRLQILMIFLLPVALVGGLYLLGLTVSVPVLGRSYVIRIILPEPGAHVGLPPIEGPQDASRPLVVIDAGHGGHDPGAVGEGFKEKTLALGLARALRDELVREGGIRVALTRSDDRFLVLEERAEIARRLGADLFLSIHADSAGEKDQVTGASVYTLSDKASSEAAARFAARENSADTVNGVTLAGRSDAVNSILVDLAQRRTSGSSATFAGLIVREGKGVLQFHPQPLRSAALAVLRAPDVPSVLYESGFVTNPNDAERLSSPEGRERFAKVMARAIKIYFARQAGV